MLDNSKRAGSIAFVDRMLSSNKLSPELLATSDETSPRIISQVFATSIEQAPEEVKQAVSCNVSIVEAPPLPAEIIGNILNFCENSRKSQTGAVSKDWQAVQALHDREILKKLNTDNVDILKLGFCSWDEVFKWVTAKGLASELTSFVFHINDTTPIAEIIKHCPHILKLKLRGYVELKGCDESEPDSLLKLKHLRHLSIEAKAVEGLYRDLAFFTELTHLDLSSVWGGGPHIENPIILKSLKNLEFLVLNGNSKITDEGLEAFSTSLTKLNSLSLDGAEITDTGLMHLKKLPKLEYLKLGHCPKITGVGLIELTNLLRLDLTQSMNSQLTDAGLQTIASGSPKLEYLDLQTESPNLRFKGSSLKAFSGLRFLNITGNDAIKERTLKEIFTSCTKLQYLICKGQQITDKVAACLAKHCQGLEDLRITESALKDEGVKHLAKLRNLRILDLNGNQHITDASLESLGALSNLKELGLRNCKEITFKSPKINYKKLFANLRVLNIKPGWVKISSPVAKMLLDRDIVTENQLRLMSPLKRFS